jgi:hypothetical protein
MRARMWKPGQSGNPAGVSKAYAEAMREISVRTREPSLGAERTRRWRQKRQQGVSIRSLTVPPACTQSSHQFQRLENLKINSLHAALGGHEPVGVPAISTFRARVRASGVPAISTFRACVRASVVSRWGDSRDMQFELPQEFGFPQIRKKPISLHGQIRGVDLEDHASVVDRKILVG